MTRIRKRTEVSCKDCSKSFFKRVDCIKNWSGRCKPCADGIKTRGKRRVFYKNCIKCGKESKWIGISNSCKNCVVRPHGNKHYNWNGGVTTENTYQRSLFLKNTKPKILLRDNYTCQICQRYGGNLHVDHIKSWSKNIELRFRFDNCRTVCMACHYYITFKRKIPSGLVWGNNLSKKVIV